MPPQPCENEYILDFISEKSLRAVEGGVTWKFDPTVFVLARAEAMHEHLANVRCRVALMRGEHSYVVPPETGEYMYQLLRRNAPLVEIPDAHHHLILDQPLAFIAWHCAFRLADWEHFAPAPDRVRIRRADTRRHRAGKDRPGNAAANLAARVPLRDVRASP